MKRPGRIFAVCGALVCLLGVPSASALPFDSVPQGSYTYNAKGDAIQSANAFVPVRQLTARSFHMEEKLRIGELCVRGDTVYLLDSGQGCVYLLDQAFQMKGKITDFIQNGTRLALSSPEGMYVTEKGEIYIADTQNRRIVVCGANGGVLAVHEDPGIFVEGEKMDYLPSKLAVDAYGRMFVVAKNVNRGVIGLNPGGSFSGFLGAPKVSMDWKTYLYRMFATEEQRKRLSSFVPAEYNNVSIDKEGFVYATVGTLSASSVKSAVALRDRSGTVTPVRKLNVSGEDILPRNGFCAPLGDLQFDADEGNSVIVDVAVKENGMYSLADQRRGRIFTYDQNGNLLYIFGGEGGKLGAFTSLCAIDYFGDLLVAADHAGTITVFAPTEFGAVLLNAVTADYNGDYEKAQELWDRALAMDPNLYVGYTGKGKIEYRRANYGKAMTYFRLVGDMENYSRAKQRIRTGFLKDHAVLILGGVLLLSAFAAAGLLVRKRRGRAAQPAGAPGRGISVPSKGPRFLYVFHTMAHPFDGFYDLKHEKRGSLKTALLLYALLGFSALLRSQFTDYLFGGQKDTLPGFFSTLALSVGVYLLWCVANWCFSSLMDGEASLKDLITVTGYAVFPLFFSNIIYTVLSHFLIQTEAHYITIIDGFASLWVLAWVFIAMMVVQQYSFGKSVGTAVLTIVGMALILFILLLLFYLVQQVYIFIIDLYREIGYRISA